MTRGVTMDVAGSGKSPVGIALAERVGAVFIGSDDPHPKANVETMRAGIPLTDGDRVPWLAAVGDRLRTTNEPTPIGWWALKLRYRDTIRASAGGPVDFIHLTGTRVVIEARMAQRQSHFMPASLIDSHFAALEPLEPGEHGFEIDMDPPPGRVVAAAANAFLGDLEWAETSR